MLKKAIEQLRNREAGWVNRRDAALQLGKMAAEALEVLREHSTESDVDVSGAAKEALGHASAGLRGVAAVPQSRAYTLAELAKGCESEGRRKVSAVGDGYVVHVTLEEGRGQDVRITPFEHRDGTKLIRVYTRCGSYDEASLRWALRTNMKIVQGALAINEEEGESEFVLTNCFLSGEVSPEEIKTSVKELAYYGDWIEKKLTGQDEL